jgi:peptidoglycan/xylan/chitin deacetylase (PgdA/CDA1 family)
LKNISLRIDRILSLMMAGFNKSADRNKIVVLMYHSVSEKIANNLHPYFETTTTPLRFMEHLQLLRRGGFEITLLMDAIKSLEKGPPNIKKAVITFDDGFKDFYDNAAPLLRYFDYPAALFLPVNLIGKKGLGLENKEHLNWLQVKECSNQGIELGSHTLDHPTLVNLNDKQVKHQIGESKRILECKTGKKIEGFCYPYRFPEERMKFTKTIKKYVHDAGYDYCLTTSIGRVSCGDDRYFLKRIPINEYDDERLFNAKLCGAYDWLHSVQLLKKIIINSIKINRL